MTDVMGIVCGAGGEFDERFEFDAPRFHDFQKSTPEEDAVDAWFNTSATKRGYPY